MKTICPFCCGNLTRCFSRQSRQFSRCCRCRAYVRSDEGSAETQVYDTGAFAARIEAGNGQQPAFDTLAAFERYLRPGRLLEVGSGTGHLLAAARKHGFQVSAIERNAYHRHYLKTNWGIEAVAEQLETNTLQPASLDNVLSVNVFEHIADPYQHCAAAFRVLRPGGRFIISTANADSLVVDVCGRWSSTFTPEDHVSIPSCESLRVVGERAGFTIARMWCSEYPLETPAGFAVALRNWWMSRSTKERFGFKPSHESGTSAAVRLMQIRLFTFVADVFSG